MVCSAASSPWKMAALFTTKKQGSMSFNHRVSFCIVCARVVKYAFQNLWRNAGIAFITITILTLALVSVNALFGLRALTTAAIAAVEHQVDVSIFFNPRATPEQIEKIKNYVYQVAAVTKSDYISPEQSLAAFRERHSTDPDIIKSLDVLDNNPLGAILVVRTKDTADYKKILTALAADEFKTVIQKRSFEDRGRIVENVQLLTSRLERFSAGLALLAARVIDPYLGPLIASGGFSLYNTFFHAWYLIFGLQFALVLTVAWLTAALAMRQYLRR